MRPIPFRAEEKQYFLRPFNVYKDKESLSKHANNEKVWRNLRDTFPHPYTTQHADDWCKRVGNNILNLAIVLGHGHGDSEMNVAIGGISVEQFDQISDLGSRRGELGYWLGEAYWGQGVMSKAVEAFLPHVWANLPQEVIRLYTTQMAWNGASVRIVEKHGFQFEGRLKQHYFKDKQLVDVLIYGLLRPGYIPPNIQTSSSSSAPNHTATVSERKVLLSRQIEQEEKRQKLRKRIKLDDCSFVHYA